MLDDSKLLLVMTNGSGFMNLAVVDIEVSLYAVCCMASNEHPINNNHVKAIHVTTVLQTSDYITQLHGVSVPITFMLTEFHL